MINNADITIFNQIIGDDRREVFIPTTISGVCWYDVRSLGQVERNRDPAAKFIIRIPISAGIQDGRSYVTEEQYKKLTPDARQKYWTIQRNSYITKIQFTPISDWLWDPFSFRHGTISHENWFWDTFSFRYGVISKEKIEDIRKLREVYSDFAQVVEYADNTVRGTNATKHWRIGGA